MSGQNQKTASGPQSLYKQLLSLNARQQARGSFRKNLQGGGGGAKARQKTFLGKLVWKSLVSCPDLHVRSLPRRMALHTKSNFLGLWAEQ